MQINNNFLIITIIIVAIVGLIFIVRKLQQAKKRKAAGIFLVKLHEALENTIDEVVGRHYGRQDRSKIAAGMIAVMAAREISLERLASDKKLFGAVLLEAIARLTEMKEIATR